MKIQWLGWAGVEIEEQGEHIVIDPLQDATAVFAWTGKAPAGMTPPEVTPPRAVASLGLITHLHRDHADALALSQARSPHAAVYEPEGYGGGEMVIALHEDPQSVAPA